MAIIRRTFSAPFWAKVALTARARWPNESRFDVHPNHVAAWKKKAIEGMVESLSDARKRLAKDDEEHEAKLFQQIGQLQFELDWLKISRT